MQLHVQLVSYDWQEVTYQLKAEWRSVCTMFGAQCVMIPGTAQMLLLCVDS